MMSKESFHDNKNEKDAPHNRTRRDFLKMAGAGIAGGVLGVGKGESGHESMPNSPFNLEVQKEILQHVAEKMGINLDSGIEFPAVVRAEEMSDKIFNQIMGFDTKGARTSGFHPPHTIILHSDSKIHNLAHEYVHYIQYHYRGHATDDDPKVEDEAVRIQDFFRK